MHIGLPERNTAAGNFVSYYYVVFNESMIDSKAAQVILDTISGEADMMVNLQSNPNYLEFDEWVFPNASNYEYASYKIVVQDTIRIDSSDLYDCIEEAKDELDEYVMNDEAECAIVIGVVGKFLELSQFSLVSFFDMQVARKDTPITASIEKGEYQYFLYDAKCGNCSLIVGLQSIGGGDADLFVNYGEKSLPTNTSFDFSSNKFGSEFLILDSSQQYFQDNNLTSIESIYILAVYAKRRTTFILQVTENEQPIVSLQQDNKVRDTQPKYETKYFQFVPKDREDIKIRLLVKAGSADMYVNTYNHDSDSETIVERIPSSMRKAVRYIQNIKATSSPA